ncbi:hypothetical protein KKE06_04475 [Candidatus Micrarchaeota archaeon]|nr:hypothetical protein [Candidatus Micrarchaeota archaeon]
MNKPNQEAKAASGFVVSAQLLTRVSVLFGCPYCGASVTSCENSIGVSGNSVFAINTFVCLDCRRPFDYVFQELHGADAILAREIINGIN